ncbi:hypothetical protein FIBSPDRAFT_963456 [Athelia psychrophila]|uniref:Uncharacterized protein n=1 Tax=Athelia psychrophila TaxID=1759441 RepID=A0A165YZ23_9AGAM|nr:hypothetical protein FIBSPDRAFT_963456 [Fibularhizoctonia sp. CBS 109695]
MKIRQHPMQEPASDSEDEYGRDHDNTDQSDFWNKAREAIAPRPDAPVTPIHHRGSERQHPADARQHPTNARQHPTRDHDNTDQSDFWNKAREAIAPRPDAPVTPIHHRGSERQHPANARQHPTNARQHPTNARQHPANAHRGEATDYVNVNVPAWVLEWPRHALHVLSNTAPNIYSTTHPYTLKFNLLIHEFPTCAHSSYAPNREPSAPNREPSSPNCESSARTPESSTYVCEYSCYTRTRKPSSCTCHSSTTTLDKSPSPPANLPYAIWRSTACPYF